MSKYKCRNFECSEWNEWCDDIRTWVKEETGCEAINVYKDGIICESVFSNSDFRPLFILKEVSDKDGFSEEPLSILETDIKTGKPSMWRRVVSLAKELYNIYNGGEKQPYRLINSTEKEEYEKYRDMIAVINLKKAHGGTSTGTTESQITIDFSCHAYKYRERLINQIRLINPSVIICCSTYDIVKNKVFQGTLETLGCPIIDGRHPTQNSNENFYNKVRDKYVETLKFRE